MKSEDRILRIKKICLDEAKKQEEGYSNAGPQYYDRYPVGFVAALKWVALACDIELRSVDNEQQTEMEL